MIKFNDYHILTGEIKELLTTFNLPKYRGGKWLKVDSNYHWGKYIRNYTRRLKINTNSYDSYTHEYLGWYLRFLRDYKKIDLLPLYNCYSDNECDNLELTEVDFDSYDSNFKIYSLPIMLGKQYTIALDSSLPIEICCAIYDKYQNDEQFSIPSASYKKYSAMYFHSPELYDTNMIYEKLCSRISGLTENATEEAKEKIKSQLNTYEADIRMFIKIPANNSSSIVILEGDYRKWNDTLMRTKTQETAAGNFASVWETVSNHVVTNFENDMRMIDGGWENLMDIACLKFKPITPLQLLRINSGVSYPFADRLIEYLTGNAITNDDELQDNVERIQQTLSFADWTDLAQHEVLTSPEFKQPGLWDDRIRPILYDYMQRDVDNGNDRNHDILGYVDKDIETYYHTYEKTSAGYVVHSIATEDIYPNLYLDSKE